MRISMPSASIWLTDIEWKPWESLNEFLCQLGTDTDSQPQLIVGDFGSAIANYCPKCHQNWYPYKSSSDPKGRK